jgi:hypothetical protein
MAWKQPQLTEPPMISDEIAKINRRLLLAYPKASQAVEEGVTLDDVFTEATHRATMNFQRYINDEIKAGREQGKPLREDGVFDYATKLRARVVIPAPTGPVAKKYVQQGVGFDTSAFMMGNPAHSYIDAVNEGSAEGMRLSLPTVGVPKVGIAYSMGGDVLKRWMQLWPADRRDEWKLLVVFGNPSRKPGPTLLGNDPGGKGISGSWYPEWTLSRLYDFTQPGDMYPNAVGVMPQMYQILTRMEASIEFAMYLFQMLTSSFGPLLLGFAGMAVPGAGLLSGILPMVTPGAEDGNPATSTEQVNLLAIITNIGGIIAALGGLINFVRTNAHFRYHDQPQPFWRGLTGVDCAAQIIQELVPGGALTYTVPGTVAHWNDGPPAWTAWKLP